MNALTKAFVVVVTILAVVLVALVIPFAARVPDYAQQYEDLERDLKAQIATSDAAAADARNLMAAKGKEVEEALKLIEEQSEKIAILEADKKGLEGKLAQAETTQARSSAAQQVMAQLLKDKDGQIADSSALIQKQITQLGDLNSQIADLSQTLINVRADNRRLSINYMRIQEENKALVTQLTEIQAKADALEEQIAALQEKLGTELVITQAPPIEIRGSVTKIDQINEGLTFVQINVGTRDEVKEGMEFTVSRGDAFVGKIKISTVDTGESVGRLTLGGGIQEGDAVRAGGRK